MTVATGNDLETALRPVVSRFQRYYLGRTPRTTTFCRAAALIVIRMSGALTDAENRLVQADPSPTSRELIELLFRRTVRQAQDALVGAVESAISQSVTGLFCDLDASSSEALIALSTETEAAA